VISLSLESIPRTRASDLYSLSNRMPTKPDKIYKLPGGWNKIVRTRHSGKSIGSNDTYFISPGGAKLRSTLDLANHIREKNLYSTVDPNQVNFENSKQRQSGEASGQVTKATQDFIDWVDSKGATNPKFLERKPKRDRKCEKCGMRRTGPLAQQQPDKLCGSCRIAKNSGPYKLLKLFFDCHNFLPFEKDMILLEKQTGLQKLQIISWFTEQIQQVNMKSEVLTKERIPDFETDTDEEFHGFVSDDDTTLGQRYGNVSFLKEVEADNQVYLIKTEIDEGVEESEYEIFCDPTNQEDSDEALFEVKEELDEGAEGPEYEKFCNPTNLEDCGDVLLKVKEEPKDDFDSVESWVEYNIKQEVPKEVENGQKSSQNGQKMPDFGYGGVEVVLEFEIFCEPTNKEDCGDAQFEVKEEPKNYLESVALVEDLIKQDECVEGPELETFCDPTNQEDCDETLFEVKEELDEGTEGAEGPQYETFCDPTNQKYCDKALFDVKEEPKEYSESDEARVEDMIKQNMFLIPIKNNFIKQEVYEVDDDEIPDDFD